MLKQPPTGIKKILAVLLAAFFVVSLSAVSVDARGGGGHGGWGSWRLGLGWLGPRRSPLNSIPKK
jgi:hypothetical protein